jgi:peptidoglycan/LPS O-acetylase OafA/YrhL
MITPSVVPSLLFMLLYLLVGHLIVRRNHFYQDITSTSTRNRYETLDGLRGFAALGVFFHHSVVTRNEYLTGKWCAPEGFYGLLGPIGVSFFFMITGFLFWRKAIRGGGKINAIGLWKNRLLRIGPMYLFTLAVMLLIVAVQSRFHLQESLRAVIGRVLVCCTLGAFLPSAVNGVEFGRIDANVCWTLSFEWAFYITLPFLAWFATPKRLAWFCVAAMIAFVAIPSLSQLCVFFLFGMVVAQMVAMDYLKRFFGGTAWPLLGIVVLTAIAVTCGSSWGRLPVMLFTFATMAYDSPLFTCLRWPASKFLGVISYSVYLMHGIVLFVVFGAINLHSPIETVSSSGFWAITCCCGLLTVLLSAITYRFVEHPFLRVRNPIVTATEQHKPAPATNLSGTGRLAYQGGHDQGD